MSFRTPMFLPSGGGPTPTPCECCGHGKTPTVILDDKGAGAGASALIDPNSTNMAGNIIIRTGDHPDPMANALVATIVFDPGQPFASPPFPIIQGVNEETQEHIDRIFVEQLNTTAAKFEIWSGDIALEEREQYSLNWVCFGSCTGKAPPPGIRETIGGPP